MKRLSFRLLAGSLLLVLSLYSQTWAQGRNPAITKWEYLIERGCTWPQQERLDQLGQEGWELVAASGYGSNNDCQGLVFKRPRPKNAPIIVPAKPTPTPTPAPACTMTLEQSPTVHGLRLGLTAAELAAILPESKRSIEYALKQPILRQTQAMQNLSFRISDLRFADSEEEKALIRQFAPASNVSIYFYNEKIARFSLSYLSTSHDLFEWNEQTWIQKLAESFGLPNFESWHRPKGGGFPMLTCAGFEATAHPQSLMLSDPAAFASAKQWLADEDVRLRREFKP